MCLQLNKIKQFNTKRVHCSYQTAGETFTTALASTPSSLLCFRFAGFHLQTKSLRSTSRQVNKEQDTGEHGDISGSNIQLQQHAQAQAIMLTKQLYNKRFDIDANNSLKWENTFQMLFVPLNLSLIALLMATDESLLNSDENITPPYR